MPDDIRVALEALYRDHRLRTVGNLRGRRPEVPSFLSDIYEAFYLLDRDGISGRVQLSSMRLMLEMLSIEERAEQFLVMRIWRQMDARRHEADERLRKEEKKSGDGKARTRGPERPG